MTKKTAELTPNEEKAGYYADLEFPFKMVWIMSMLFRVFTMPKEDIPEIVTHFGALTLVAFAMFIPLIYCNRKKKGLITYGCFRYTRHPMYTCIALNGAYLWWPVNDTYLTVGYWASFISFYTFVVITGYLQEKETLARFGAEAEEYYRRTPRVFLFYPFMKR